MGAAVGNAFGKLKPGATLNDDTGASSPDPNGGLIPSQVRNRKLFNLGTGILGGGLRGMNQDQEQDGGGQMPMLPQQQDVVPAGNENYIQQLRKRAFMGF